MSQPRARPKSLPVCLPLRARVEKWEATYVLETMLADLGGEIVVLADGLQKTVTPAPATLLSQMHEFRRRRRRGARRTSLIRIFVASMIRISHCGFSMPSNANSCVELLGALHLVDLLCQRSPDTTKWVSAAWLGSSERVESHANIGSTAAGRVARSASHSPCAVVRSLTPPRPQAPDTRCPCRCPTPWRCARPACLRV